MAGGKTADLSIGKILSPHGVTGAVKIWPYANFPERYRQLQKAEVHLRKSGSSDSTLPAEPLRVSKVSAYGKYWLIKFEQIRSREEAEKVKGFQIYLSAEAPYPLPEGSFYFNQVIGLSVYDSGKYKGKVTGIRSTPGHDLYVISGGEGKEIMLPAVKEFVKEIDLEEGIMRIQLPEGLENL